MALVDVLVSIAVVALLLALMLPTLGSVRETANRVICRSNARQLGIGVAMYADAWSDRMPPTVLVGRRQRRTDAPGEADTLRLDKNDGRLGNSPTNWDGLGRLYYGELFGAPKIFYCPSHKGTHTFNSYEREWHGGSGRIIGNYHYRGLAPADNGRGQTYYLSQVDPRRSAIIADQLRSKVNFNHGSGLNVLLADLTVFWYSDDDGELFERLAEGNGVTGVSDMGVAWGMLDEGSGTTN